MCGALLHSSASRRRNYPMTTRPLPGQDWTESERAEIRRLEKVCDAPEHWTLECSQTHIRRPLVYQHRRIILHIAHIERSIRGGVAARATTCEGRPLCRDARGPLHNARAANRYGRSWAMPNHVAAVLKAVASDSAMACLRRRDLVAAHSVVTALGSAARQGLTVSPTRQPYGEY
jgi:hypothetical protein